MTEERGASALRIAFLSEHASPVALLGGVDSGGQNVYVDELSRNLGRLGLAVDVFTRRDSADAPEIIDWAPGVRVVNLRAGPPQFVPKDDLWAWMPVFRDALLDFIVREEARYDVVHGNFWMSGWVAAELRHTLGVPVAQIFHAMGKTKQQHQGAADTSPSERIEVEMQVVDAAERLIAQCPAEERELVEDYGAERRKVVVIPSAVSIETFRPVPRAEARHRVGVASDELVVVYVGRMVPRKDARNVVRAVGILVRETTLPVKLLLVGGETAEPDPAVTPEIGELQRIVAEEGIADRVQFVGKRQPEVLRDYYSAGDVAVTTPWYEPFGLTPLEAMACGRPVIGSAVGGITFTIADGETGFLVPPRDPRALATRLADLLVDPVLQARMGRAARRRVEQEFTWPVVAERTMALYQTMLGERKDAWLLRATAGGACGMKSNPRSEYGN